MTKIIKTLVSLILALATLFVFFGTISTQAQYGGTTITFPTSPRTNPTTPVTPTTTTTVNNRCAGSNVSSSVAGETLNINLCNIKSGNTIILNNLSTSSIESIELSFNSDVSDGLFQVVKIPESLAFPNLNGNFITAFEVLTTRFDRSAIRSIKLNFKVDRNIINRFSALNAFTASSPWVATNLTRVSEDANVVRFTSTTGSFNQYALSGTVNTTAATTTTSPASTVAPRPNSNFDLIRTGGQTQLTGILTLGFIAMVTMVVRSKRNLLKI